MWVTYAGRRDLSYSTQHLPVFEQVARRHGLFKERQNFLLIQLPRPCARRTGSSATGSRSAAAVLAPFVACRVRDFLCHCTTSYHASSDHIDSLKMTDTLRTGALTVVSWRLGVALKIPLPKGNAGSIPAPSIVS
jgi:hypothetical protein